MFPIVSGILGTNVGVPLISEVAFEFMFIRCAMRNQGRRDDTTAFWRLARMTLVPIWMKASAAVQKFRIVRYASLPVSKECCSDRSVVKTSRCLAWSAQSGQGGYPSVLKSRRCSLNG